MQQYPSSLFPLYPIQLNPGYFVWINSAMLMVAGLLILFIFFYLHYDLRRRKTCQLLRIAFSDLISEVILCADENERNQVWEQFKTLHTSYRREPLAREVLAGELMRLHKSLNGLAAANIQWLYEGWELQLDALQLFKSEKWDQKARAIQQLAQIAQKQSIIRIFKATSHPNPHVRMEAQIALVKLTGFDGLRFLQVLRHPLSPWHQLCLLQELSFHQNIQPGKIATWLQSSDQSVVELALKLVRQFQCFELHDAVAALLTQSAPMLHAEVLRTLKEINQPQTADLVISYFHSSTEVLQIIALEVLRDIATGQQLAFFETLQNHQVTTVRHMANTARLQILRNNPDLNTSPVTAICNLQLPSGIIYNEAI